jgi:FKBP-type peptidyl-prolyl cis-trans isomerase
MAQYSEYGKRFGSLMLAGVFLITSLAFTGVVIWESLNNEKKDDALKSLQQSTNQQIDNQQSPNQQQTNPTGENMLKGTLLANFTPITTPVTELQIIDLKEGTGAATPEGATITADYTGAYVVNGVIFESSKDSGQPATFPLSGVIPGWTQGVPGMKVGGIRRLVIPGTLAYGEAPEGYTPGSGSRPLGPLVFDIELVSLGQ